MSEGKGYGLYWRVWGLLLVLTATMIALDSMPLPYGILATVMVLAMLFKATLIGAYFMHLRYERLFLGLSVAIGLVLNGFILFGLLAPDGLRIMEMLAS